MNSAGFDNIWKTTSSLLFADLVLDEKGQSVRPTCHDVRSLKSLSKLRKELCPAFLCAIVSGMR